jgi:hypothetical protein
VLPLTSVYKFSFAFLTKNLVNCPLLISVWVRRGKYGVGVKGFIEGLALVKIL